jgi:hypothetical protein
MTTGETTRGGSVGSILTIVLGIVTLLVVLGIGYTFLPSILATPAPAIFVLPTAAIVPAKAPVPPGARPQQGSAPITVSAPADAAIDAYNATAQAQYQEAISAPVENTGQSVPVQLVTKPSARQPAGDNVPTAEPLVEGAPIVNIQATQQCLHGQTWTERGCKNPTSKGSKAKP